MSVTDCFGILDGGQEPKLAHQPNRSRTIYQVLDRVREIDRQFFSICQSAALLLKRYVLSSQFSAFFSVKVVTGPAGTVDVPCSVYLM